MHVDWFGVCSSFPPVDRIAESPPSANEKNKMDGMTAAFNYNIYLFAAFAPRIVTYYYCVIIVDGLVGSFILFYFN